MRKRVNIFLMVYAVVALQPSIPIASLASDGGDPAEQAGEDRWVPSLAITGGATIQKQDARVDSVLFEDGSGSSVPLRGSKNGDDIAASPFVGGSLEVMTPALPIPTRPRLFLSGVILPTFAFDRDVALEGDPDCVRGPEPGSPCVADEGTSRRRPFPETSINGQGSRTSAQVDTLVYGANLGVAFPARFGKRQLRIRPSVGWISYKVRASGLVVDGACDPVTQCTDVFAANPTPPPDVVLVSTGFVRETTLVGTESHRFNGIGPGAELEMDAGRFGPLGVSLFVGGGAYRILGDRTIAFEATQSFDDQLGTDQAVGTFEVDVDPWMYRANVGIRFQWLGGGS